jgi:hypothetical protein
VKPLRMQRMRLLLAAALMMVTALVSARAQAATTVDSVELSQGGAALKVGLSADLNPSVANLGDRLVIKLKGAALKDGLKLPEGAGLVKELRSGDHSGVLWIVAVLTSPVRAHVKRQASGFDVTLAAKGQASPAASGPPAEAAQAAAPASAEVEALSPSGANQTARIVDVSLGQAGEESQVVISSDAPASYKSSVSEGGKKVSLSFRNASLSWAGKELGQDDPALRSVSARQISVHGEAQVLVELSLRDKTAYTITRDQNQVMVNVARPAGATQSQVSKSKGNLDMPTSVDFEDADVVGVLRGLSQQGGFDCKISNGILSLASTARMITYDATDRPLREVIWGILTQLGGTTTPMAFNLQDNTLYFGLATEIGVLKAGTVTTTKFYVPRNQSKSTLEALVKGVSKQPGESLAAMADDPTDPDKIMVTGPEGDVATTLAYLRKWDVAQTGEASASDDADAAAQAEDDSPDAGSKKTQIFRLKYLDANDQAMLTAAIAEVIPPEAMKADVSGNVDFVSTWDPNRRSLVVTSKVKYLKKLATLIDHLDVPIPEVHIEGKIIEVDQDDSKSLGIKWGYTQNSSDGTQQTILGFGASQGGAATAQIINSQTLSSLNATVDALVSKNHANVISSPSITVKDGQAASVQGVDTIPIPQSTTIFNSAGNPSTSLTFTNQQIPINLGVTPQIRKEDKKIEMLVSFQLTTATGPSLNGAPEPTTQQTLQTTVMVSDGETAVIGGLSKDSWTEKTSQVPVLGDIPLLGLLFKGKSTEKIKNDIIIFITPTIVEN